MTDQKAVPRTLLRRSWLLPAAGLGLAAATAMRYYLTHPQRAVAELPGDLVAGAKDLFVTAEDGARLHAIWLGGRGDRTIIHHHGYNSSGGIVLARRLVMPPALQRPPFSRLSEGQLSAFVGEDAEPLTAWPLVRAALGRGYNCLLVDIRGHGRSDGPWDSKGALPMDDLLGWVRWLREEQGQRWAGLWGNSFGASVGLALAAQHAGGGIDAMVLDSPAISGRGLYSGRVRPPIYWAIQPVIQVLANHDLWRALQNVHAWMPILLIHGMADTHVPSWQSEQVYKLIWDATAPERAELWLVPGADHLEALEVAPEMYVKRTLDWFDRWLGDNTAKATTDRLSF
ncbi:MAG: alpha/beta hydrolase [Chloroflexi bacterium]|nr:alpha/beta hydrolase [Chloroflexota bacterium]